MSLERKVGKVGSQAKKFGLYFRTVLVRKIGSDFLRLAPSLEDLGIFAIKLVRPRSAKEMLERPTPRKYALILIADKYCAF